MAYPKQNFSDGNVLFAAQLNAMDNQIAKNENDITALKEDIANIENGTVSVNIGDISTLSYASQRYTTQHLIYADAVELKSSDAHSAEGIEYSWRIFNATGGYISSAWNTEYTIPANTEFYLLIRKTENGTQKAWEESEAKESVLIQQKTKIQKQIDAIDGRVTTAETNIASTDEKVDALDSKVSTILPQVDIKDANFSGRLESSGASVNKATYIYYNFIEGEEYTVAVTAKGDTHFQGSRTLIIATSTSENSAKAIDFFSNSAESPMGIIANLKSGDTYTGTLCVTQSVPILIVVAYTSASSDFDIDVRISKSADIKKTVEKVFDCSMVGLNKDIEPTVMQLGAEIPSASDYGKSPYKRLTFAHFSDIHAQPDRWGRICDYIDAFDHIKFAVHTGDYTGSYLGDIKDLYAEKKPKNKPILNIIGNHDTFSSVNPYVTTDKHTVKNAVFASVDPVADGWDCTFGTAMDAMYWYKDDADSKVRIIGIDQYYWDDTESNWFSNVLADAKNNDYAVVLLTHSPFTKKITSIGSTFWTMGGWDTGTSETESDSTIVAIRNAIATFRASGGLFLCYLCGHIHSDQIGTLDTDGILQIRIENASGIGVWCESDRTVNTKNYDCMNLIQIDRAYGLIKVVRVGVNVDPHMQNKNALCYDYVNRKLIANW